MLYPVPLLFSSFIFAYLTWVPLPLSGSYPPPSFDFTYVFSSPLLILFGGNTESGVSDDLFFYDTVTNAWTEAPQVGDAWPSARCDAGGLVYNNSLFIFGGKSDSSFLNDMWVWDSLAMSWSLLGKSSLLSSGSSVAQISDDTYLFFGGQPELNVFSNSIVSFSATTQQVNTLRVNGETFPEPRTWASVVYSSLSNSLFLFGGYNGKNMDDAWIFDLDTSQWKKLSPRGDWPPPRSGSMAVYFALASGVYLFGGEDLDGHGMNDLWFFDMSAYTWKEIEAIERPPSRLGGAIALSSLLNENATSLLVFGGKEGWSTDTLFNDLWYFPL